MAQIESATPSPQESLTPEFNRAHSNAGHGRGGVSFLGRWTGNRHPETNLLDLVCALEES